MIDDVRKARSDLLDQIKSRIGSDPKFRDDFFANPEEALKASDLASQADALKKAVRADDAGCTWTCAWTGAAPESHPTENPR